MKKEVRGLNLVRMIAALGIILYHIGMEMSTWEVAVPHKYGFYSANGQYSFIWVTIFFMLSGTVLYWNYEKVEAGKLLKWWGKRLLTIYASFLPIYLICYFNTMIQYYEPFYQEYPLRLLFALTGFNGYFIETMPQYYFIGEWFLFPIVVMYLIYPLLAYCFEKSKLVTSIVITLLFLVTNFAHITIGIDQMVSMSGCLFSFFLGMLICYFYKKLDQWPLWTWIAAMALFITCLYVEVPFVDVAILYRFICVFGYIGIWGLGDIILKLDWLHKIVAFFSSISFEVFLVHHIWVIRLYKGLAYNIIDQVQYFKYLAFLILVVVLEAFMLKLVGDGIKAIVLKKH